ncbi:MAG: translation initiation factor IF-3 [Clostridia bacterium]|nr:translation initiation factor IF-3 [Clostridia bacterium]
MRSPLVLFKKGRYKVIKEQHQINEAIRDKEVRLIGQEGEQLGIISAAEAQRIADEAGLDLVKIQPNAQPPVCKILDYGKYKYDMLKREKEQKKNQKVVEIKEIWLSMTIDIGDLNVKAKQTVKFLAGGNKVKVSIRLRGRQNAHSNLGLDVMVKFFEMLEGKAVMDKKPGLEGRTIIMVLSPAKANETSKK